MNNAKIQFTVKFDDIPDEVKERLTRNAHRVEQLSIQADRIASMMKNGRLLDAIKELQEFRQEINYCDMVSEDCYNILVGYTSHKAKMLENTQESTPQPQQEEPPKGE